MRKWNTCKHHPIHSSPLNSIRLVMLNEIHLMLWKNWALLLHLKNISGNINFCIKRKINAGKNFYFGFRMCDLMRMSVRFCIIISKWKIDSVPEINARRFHHNPTGVCYSYYTVFVLKYNKNNNNNENLTDLFFFVVLCKYFCVIYLHFLIIISIHIKIMQ